MKTLIYFSAIVLLAACTPIYVPTVQSVPLLREKGQTVISGNLGGTAQFPDQYSFNVAHAFSDKMAFMGNANAISRRGKWGLHESHLVEGGLGSFTTFGQYGIFEVYGLLGAGRVSNNYTNGERLKAQQLRFSLQPSIGFKGKFGSIAASFKFVYNSYNTDPYIVSAGQTMSWPLPSFHSDYLRANTSIFTYEPAITYGFGNETFNAMFQTGVCGSINKFIYYDFMWASFGVKINLNKHKKTLQE